MTRFKELRRIEAAIDNSDERELRWALSYAETRLRDAVMKEHEKHWRKIVKRVQQAIDELCSDD